MEKLDARAYVEWGGMYDVRDLELIEWKGEFHYEDNTGGHMTIHDHLKPRASAIDAKEELIRFVFDLGEADTYVDFGPEGIVRKRDCIRMTAAPWNWVSKTACPQCGVAASHSHHSGSVHGDITPLMRR